MDFHCLLWIQHFWCQLVCTLWIRNRGDIECLPDDLIVQILSRLSVGEVLKCRKVCKKWRALTSSRQFAEEHLKHKSPMLFLQHLHQENKLELYFLDEKVKILKNTRNERIDTKFMDNAQNDRPVLVDSCDGLLIFEASKVFYLKIFICNPVTQEVVTLMKPSHDCHIYGIFFHSSTKEYRLLVGRQLVLDYHEYFIHSIGSKSWRVLGTFHHQIFLSTSVNSNGSLHWVIKRGVTPCNKSLLVLNSNLEKFKVLPHPGWQCRSKLCEASMLLTKTETDGLSFGILDLCFVKFWVLKDHEKWSWSPMHAINLESLGHLGEKMISDPKVEIGNIQNNELLLVGFRGEIFRYNLCTKTTRKLYGKNSDELLCMQHMRLRIRSYTKSLVSLKDLYGGYRA